MRRFLLPLVAALLLAGCATTSQRVLPMPPTPEEIVQLSADGTPPAEILARMQASRAVYRLSATELAKLRERGVADAVIDYMQRTQIEAARRETARLYAYPHWSRTWPGYPRGFGWAHPYWGPAFGPPYRRWP